MKNFSLFLTNTLYLLVGTFLLAVGIGCFLTPNKLSVGGASAIGTILLYLCHVPLSITNLLVNSVLFVLGYKSLGKTAILKTVAGVFLLSAFLEVVGLFPSFVGNTTVAAITGGSIIGLGVGLIMRRGASSGGSDFVALILRRFFPHVSLANFILITDCVIIVLSGFVFKEVEITTFSLVSLYLASKIADTIITFGTTAKTVTIVSEHRNEIATYIQTRLGRGVTALSGRGMFSKKETQLLWCVVMPKEVPLLVAAVRAIDKNAFVTVHDVREVFGNGFSDYK